MKIRTCTILLPLLLAACATGAERAAPVRTIVIPAGEDEAYDSWHYSPAVRVGDTVVVSGIPASRGESYDEKITAMFEQLKAVLEASGATLADVVEITTFHREPADTAAFQAEFERFLAIHKRYFREAYPAWTAVGTTALLAASAPVEMRALAIVGSGKRHRIERASASAEARKEP
ncbi:MAG TPA: Rid family hydrolase [Candidatus Saccharimonadia bacterium]|nr:Rid family hydrolase [Candidatus Saccharimonadia bacterium]